MNKVIFGERAPVERNLQEIVPGIPLVLLIKSGKLKVES